MLGFYNTTLNDTLCDILMSLKRHEIYIII